MNQNVVFAVVRHVLNAAGVVLAAKGYMDEAAVETVIGATLTWAAVVWSVVDKQKGAKL